MLIRNPTITLHLLIFYLYIFDFKSILCANSISYSLATLPLKFRIIKLAKFSNKAMIIERYLFSLFKFYPYHSLLIISRNDSDYC